MAIISLFIFESALAFSESTKRTAASPGTQVSKKSNSPLYKIPSAKEEALTTDLLNQARMLFAREDFKGTIKLLKKYLKIVPNSDVALNMMGASYMHLGLGSPALYLLKKVQDKTALKSYNQYYQGLSYLVIEKPFDAIEHFKKAAEYNDPYGERALFEWALNVYHRQEFGLAQALFRQYLLRYPRGVYAVKAQKGFNSIQENAYRPNLRGLTMPNPDEIIFAYHPWSLFNVPHFWQMQVSTGYQELQEMEPELVEGTNKSVVRNSSVLNYLLKARASFGFGPFKYGGNNLTLGYVYDQAWHTTPERVNTYLDDPGDFPYFPFRPDLMIRKHIFFAEYWRNLSYDLKVGLLLDMFFANSGSSWQWNTEDSQLQKTLPLSQGHLMVPWILANITPILDLGAYAYLYKELNKEANEFSFKTYSSRPTPVISAGVTANLKLPRYGFWTDLDLYRYEYIYNDYWSDYRRDGVTWNVAYDLVPMWSISTNLSLGIFNDTYIVPLVKQGSCSASESDVSNNEPPKECLRTDNGFMYEGSLQWTYNEAIQLAIGLNFVENKNPSQHIYDNNRQELFLKINMAFPTIKQANNYLKRLDDKSFLQKEGYF